MQNINKSIGEIQEQKKKYFDRNNLTVKYVVISRIVINTIFAVNSFIILFKLNSQQSELYFKGGVQMTYEDCNDPDLYLN